VTALDSGSFPSNWTAEILKSPPLIAPVRQFVYPFQIAGEEDALARGALQIMVRPANSSQYLLTCALGFKDPSLPAGIHACPNPNHLCAVAGGYAYLSDTSAPATCTLLPLKPATEVHPIPTHNLLLFAGFHHLAAWGPDGLAWQSARLSWEGLRLTHLEGGQLHGFGWNMLTDKEQPFILDLKSGAHTGGGYKG
jgi:hypothetical protein